MSYQWLDWAKRIQALSQSGLAFSKDIYDRERYEELQKISAEMIAAHSELEVMQVEELFAKEVGYQTPKVDVRVVRLLAVFDKNKHPHPPEMYHYYKLFILCEITGGEAALGIETTNVQFFDQTAIPALSEQRNTDSQIQTMFEFLQAPDKETLID